MSSEEIRQDIKEDDVLVEEAMEADDANVADQVLEGKTDAGDVEDALEGLEDMIEGDAALEDGGGGFQEEAQEASEEEKKADGGKKSFFGKKKEKKDPRDGQIEELTDRLKRTMAEFDNYRKRTEKEKAAMFEIGAKGIIEKILPVVDNFERGLATIPEEDKGAPFAEGMDKIYKQLVKTLEDLGVKPIDAVGQPFDPNFHNAVMHVEDESLGENVVAAELQKGYLYRDGVVRHSMVQVAN